MAPSVVTMSLHTGEKLFSGLSKGQAHGWQSSGVPLKGFPWKPSIHISQW